MMKRILILMLAVTMAALSFAFDFTGKTFRGNATPNGRKVTVTYRFKPNNRATGTMNAVGLKPQTDNGIRWEVSGGYINIFDSTGDYSYLRIDEEDGKTVLVMEDGNGNELMVLRQVNSTTTKPRSKR